MANGVYKAVSGSIAQLHHLDVLANNLANVGTPGFKADAVRFEEVLGQRLGEGTEHVDTPSTRVRLTQGPLRETGNPLDVAISGDGFFVVRSSDGERLTRNGRLVVGPDGLLRTASGHAILGIGGEIPVPPQSDGAKGTVAIDGQGRVLQGDLELGRLRRVQAGADDIRKVGADLFEPTKPMRTLAEATTGQVVQGHVEDANVNPVDVMTDIIQVQRSFEALQQAMRAYREVDSQSLRRMK